MMDRNMNGMKLIGGVMLVGCLFYCWISYPSFRSYLACYDEENKSFEEIRVRQQAQTWDERTYCSFSFEILQRNSACIQDAQQKETAFSGGLPLSSFLYPLIRPQSKTGVDWMAEHNEKCAQFPSFQFEE